MAGNAHYLDAKHTLPCPHWVIRTLLPFKYQGQLPTSTSAFLAPGHFAQGTQALVVVQSLIGLLLCPLLEALSLQELGLRAQSHRQGQEAKIPQLVSGACSPHLHLGFQGRAVSGAST